MILSVFAKKRFGLYLMWVAAVLALVTLVLGATGHAMTTSTNFGAGQWVTILLGIACVVAAWWLRFDFWPLVPSAFFSVAFGFVLNDGVPVVVDKINNISYVGGDFGSVMAYLVMLAVSVALCAVACFVGCGDNESSDCAA